MHIKMDKDERREAIATLVRLQCAVHSVNASDLPKQADSLTWKIENNPYLNKEAKDTVLVLLWRLDRGQICLCHGDFHPLNILFDGNIDWVDAACGDPLTDACRTYLIFRQYIMDEM